MKFPRNAKMLRGQMDVAPFAGVFFCLVIFVLLASLVYTPGVHIELPAAVEGMTGVDGPTFAVALDANGQFIIQASGGTCSVTLYTYGYIA